jgi:O-antigen/teichoic acid export membrane protein
MRTRDRVRNIDIRALLRRDTPAMFVAANLVAMVTSLATAPLVARSLGPAGRGQAMAVLAALALLPILLSLGVPLEVRRLAALGQGVVALRTARRFLLLAFAPAALSAFALVHWLFDELASEARTAALVGLLLTPIAMSWMLDISALVAVGRYRATSLVRVTQPLVFAALIVGTSIADRLSVPTVIIAQVTASAMTTTVGAFLTRAPLRGPRMPGVELLRGGLRFSGSSVAEAASSRLDQVLALPVLGASQAGLYSIAATIGTLPVAVAQALGASYFRSLSASEPLERPALHRSAVRAAMTLGLLACGLLAISAPLLIPLVFGADFGGAVGMTVVVLVGSVAMLVSFVCTMALVSDARGRAMSLAQGVSLVTGVLGLVTLGPALGGMGAAVASTLAYILLLGLLMFALRVGPAALLPTGRALLEGLRRLFN